MLGGGYPLCPRFNFNNPGVRDYFLDVSRHWIDFGVDGWRLDVPEEIQHDEFWRSFRRVVKEANPDAYIVGEIWHEGYDWLRGDRFDALMNYALNRAAFGFFAHDTLRTDYAPGGYALHKINGHDFARTVEHLVNLHDPQIVQAQLNLLDSHDTARVPWIVNDDESAQRLCILFQMTMPGVPCIYYGDEIGMTGANDPYCRAAFPWHDEGGWKHELLEFYRQATALRHQYPALRTGTYQTLWADEKRFAFQRKLGHQSAIVAFNTAHDTAHLELDVEGSSRVYKRVWPHQSENLAPILPVDGKISDLVVEPRAAVVLVGE